VHHPASLEGRLRAGGRELIEYDEGVGKEGMMTARNPEQTIAAAQTGRSKMASP
jgi:hypothetical protein